MSSRAPFLLPTSFELYPSRKSHTVIILIGWSRREFDAYLNPRSIDHSQRYRRISISISRIQRRLNKCTQPVRLHTAQRSPVSRPLVMGWLAPFQSNLRGHQSSHPLRAQPEWARSLVTGKVRSTTFRWGALGMVRCLNKIRSPSRQNLTLRWRDIERQATANSYGLLKVGLAKPRPAPNLRLRRASCFCYFHT